MSEPSARRRASRSSGFSSRSKSTATPEQRSPTRSKRDPRWSTIAALSWPLKVGAPRGSLEVCRGGSGASTSTLAGRRKRKADTGVLRCVPGADGGSCRRLSVRRCFGVLAGARPTDHSSSRKDGEVDEGADGVRASESGVVLPRGAGAVAIFDETTDAIRAVLDIRKAVRPLGVELRSGVHFGHCWQADE